MSLPAPSAAPSETGSIPPSSLSAGLSAPASSSAVTGKPTAPPGAITTPQADGIPLGGSAATTVEQTSGPTQTAPSANPRSNATNLTSPVGGGSTIPTTAPTPISAGNPNSLAPPPSSAIATSPAQTSLLGLAQPPPPSVVASMNFNAPTPTAIPAPPTAAQLASAGAGALGLGPGAAALPPSGPGQYKPPLNVRDALSYLDQVKVQFADQPEVYNRFLDVMKEFKGQTIDTPGVIDRVSTLFHNHPSLIQGFNTFLPPGYRIECFTSTNPSDFPDGYVSTMANAGLAPGGNGVMLISVTTPSGTVSQVPGGFAKADRERREREERAREREAAIAATMPTNLPNGIDPNRPIVMDRELTQRDRDRLQEAGYLVGREAGRPDASRPPAGLTQAEVEIRREMELRLGAPPTSSGQGASQIPSMYGPNGGRSQTPVQNGSGAGGGGGYTGAFGRQAGQPSQGGPMEGVTLTSNGSSSGRNGHASGTGVGQASQMPAGSGGLGSGNPSGSAPQMPGGQGNPNVPSRPGSAQAGRNSGSAAYQLTPIPNPPAPPAADPPQPARQAGGEDRPPQLIEFNHAIAFVNKIKNRFAGDPDTYKQFLEILQTYQKETKDINEVYAQVTVLFDNAPDLLEEFSQFLPGADGQQPAHGLFSHDLFGRDMGSGTGKLSFPIHAFDDGPGPTDNTAPKAPAKSRSAKDKEAREAAAAQAALLAQVPAVPPNKKRRGPDKDNTRARGSKKPKISHREATPVDSDPSALVPSVVNPLPASNLSHPADVMFFEKVKKFIDDRTTYHEFLKLLNLFVNDLIDMRTLVERAMLFLGGDDKDLAQEFKNLVGWEGSLTNSKVHPGTDIIGLDPLGVAENLPMLQRPKVDLNYQRASGPSYRKLPKSEVNLSCSGRDPMCWEVLNDEWVSHPTWASEDAVPSAAHKRNAYEEALHKTEEERHEYDYHIEANIRTISLLEPISVRIQQMDPTDREVFRLKSGLGGQSKSIYQRILKKIYGREQGQDVINALHDTPAMAVPVVLARLKQKDEEWKKAQREWNKVWREVDAKNFYKSLDHQGVVFKVNDKKAIGAKTLLAEVEALRAEHTQKEASSADPTALAHQERGQYRFAVGDVECLQDALKLVFSYLDRMTAAAADRDRVETFIRGFIPLFFQFPNIDFDAAFQEMGGGGDESDDGMSDGAPSFDDDDASSVSGRKSKKNGAADLRTKLLRQVLEAGESRGKNGRGKRSGSATPSVGTAGDVVADALGPDVIALDPSSVELAAEEEPAKTETSTVESSWVEMNDETSSAAQRRSAPRKYTFFGNNNYFCFFRLLQILYERLHTFKDMAAQLGAFAVSYQPVNPLAKELGITDPASASILEGGPTPTAYFYAHVLDQCEKLFDGEVDTAAFEENIRYMYGASAYPAFTLDKVVAGVIKHAQNICSDGKSQELLDLLRKDREAEATNTKQQINYRVAAENVLAPEENMFKIDWLPAVNKLRILLLAKEDVTEDLETVEQKWQNYVDSFSLNHPTEGLRYKIDPPFLRRNLVELPPDIRQEGRSGIGIKIALGNYRLFFVQGTADYYARLSSPAEEADTAAKLEDVRAERKEKMESWLQGKAAGGVGDVVMT